MGCSISAVEYTTTLGIAIATSQLEVDQVLSGTLSSCFSRAHGSPFLQPPLAPLVGPFVTGPATKEILEGTFTCLPDLDDATKQFTEALQFPSPCSHASMV